MLIDERGPRLDLKQGKRAKAFRIIEAILREDPTLARVVRNWSTWTGATGSVDTAPVVLSMLPMIRLRPVVVPSKPFSNGLRTGAIGIAVRLMTEGIHADDIINLWDAVEDALEDMAPFRGSTVGCTLRDQVGATYYDVREPAFAPRQTRGSEPTKMLTGDGQIVVTFLRQR